MKEQKDKPEKLMKIQKEAMSVNMQYMGKSMKPTFITFLPIILIFGWMNAHFAFQPLMPDQPFTVTAEMEKFVEGNISITIPEGLTIEGESSKEISQGGAQFTVKGAAGEYYATLSHEDDKQDKHIILCDYVAVRFFGAGLPRKHESRQPVLP